MKEIQELLQKAVHAAFDEAVAVELTRPDEQFGDFATNVALQLGKKLGQNPREVAEKIAAELTSSSMIAKSEVAGPGFINITLNDEALWNAAQTTPEKSLEGQKILLEYSNPNAFKELHTGHLYQTIAGDTIGRLLEASGATVYRANFGGDVGLHVARFLYGACSKLGGENPEKLADITPDERTKWISQAYVTGAKAHEEDNSAKAKIEAYNKQVYEFHSNDDHDSPLAQIYWTCREWSYDYIKDLYKALQVAPFDKFYPESTTITPGTELVKKHTGSVFTESEGAIIFPGEEGGLHTRVFITSQGLPTYETKDLGVIVSEVKDFAYNKRVVMTGNDQSEYMKVVFAAVQKIDQELAEKQQHITNGTVLFGDGKKMSSRLGNVTRAVDVVEAVRSQVEAETPEIREAITLGAIKYSFLKQRLGGDIAFDVAESVSLQGNSGPYLQYAHARARSIISKTKQAGAKDVRAYPAELNPEERLLVRKLSEYTETVDRAVADMMPHHICIYLYELAQVFNRFYENNRVIGSDREVDRVSLVLLYTTTLKNGLELLNIPAPERM